MAFRADAAARVVDLGAMAASMAAAALDGGATLDAAQFGLEMVAAAEAVEFTSVASDA